MRDDLKLPVNVNINVTSPTLDQLRTEVSGLVFAAVAWNKATHKKLDLILESLGSANDSEAIAKIRAAAAKLKASTDTLEGAVQSHSSEGQG